MSRGFPSATLAENLRFNAVHVIPNLRQGLFSRRPGAVARATAHDVDGKTVRLCARLRRKYASPALFVRLLKTRSLLLFDVAAVRQVLDRSPDPWGPPAIKVRGMEHFQPGAVTICKGEEWRWRRRFNEAVLDSGTPSHRFAETFLAAVREEAGHLARAPDDELTWPALAALFETLMLRVVFGRGGAEERQLSARLTRLMRRANAFFLPPLETEREAFLAGLRRQLADPEPGSLAARAAAAGEAGSGWVEGQLPHWMFALRDTLGANTARALAAIAAHPAAASRVRDELAAADLGSAAGFTGLAYFEGCVQEAMRLWPTTPLLSRQTSEECAVAGVRLPAGTQVLILNLFHHRDADAHPFADSFAPEVWAERGPDPHFNHFSNGPQVCAGVDLSLFLAKAVLATLLEGNRYTLLAPRLDPGRPLPYMLGLSRLRLRKEPLPAGL